MIEYLVFARKLYERPLEFLGALRVEDDAASDSTRLSEQARAQFNETDWIEMIAIPSAALTQVIPISDSTERAL
ncbi:MAG: hypothetical protein B6D41_07735 [Chloroflexi bacterium UTCFX4]|jgi:hypothetical protein|nr:MAG: hypothetical protein B6D41_07735 [Chloroflexi bacterium UTCFX4]